MTKVFFCLLSLLISFSSYSETHDSKKYVLVIFHGLGGYESGNLDEATNLPEGLGNAGIEKMYNAGHGVSEGKFKLVLDNFACKNGVQTEKNLGLIIIGYSWGAHKSYDFSQTYLKKCGRKADRAYMIDGIQKLVSQFKKAPVALVCKNFYKTVEPIRGRALDGCQNRDMTEVCKQENGTFMEGMPCHQAVLKEGFNIVMKDIQNLGSEVASLQSNF